VSDLVSRAFISLVLKVSGNVNADAGVGTRIPLKKIITWNQEIKPFVSARCIRRCIRERLAEKFGFSAIDPLQMIGEGERKQLGDAGDPVKYVDDDLFGFLVPTEPPLRRSSPIKISHLISLRHAEVKVEFAARFPRDFLEEYEHGYPVPYEVELAEWLGKLNVIVSDRIGRFTQEELSAEAKKKLGDGLSLDDAERKRRLEGFLEILLWEGWNFPRAAESPSVPEYYYAIIVLTKRFVPLFGFVDVSEEGKLNMVSVENLKKLYSDLIDHLFILDYKGGIYSHYTRSEDELKEKVKDESLNADVMKRAIIGTICDYIVGSKE